MPLAPGVRLGGYEIVAPLGAGAMGEVYRAYDIKLNRAVAIKVLAPRFASNPERLARVRREAKLLAALNHPNIAAVHTFEDVPEAQALVLELVEGQTLQDRIAKGSIPLAEALAIAKQLADTFEAAHARGIAPFTIVLNWQTAIYFGGRAAPIEASPAISQRPFKRTIVCR